MKKISLCVITILIVCLAAACSVQKTKTDKLRDLEFTVLGEEEIPEELKEKIEDIEQNGFKIPYADKGYLYIAKGYGRQETSGYSIEVKQCYETENAIYFHTILHGPKKEEEVSDNPTYPYVVVKLEWIDKNVVFE